MMEDTSLTTYDFGAFNGQIIIAFVSDPEVLKEIWHMVLQKNFESHVIKEDDLYGSSLIPDYLIRYSEEDEYEEYIDTEDVIQYEEYNDRTILFAFGDYTILLDAMLEFNILTYEHTKQIYDDYRYFMEFDNILVNSKSCS